MQHFANDLSQGMGNWRCTGARASEDRATGRSGLRLCNLVEQWHNARELPKEDFRREVEGELTGRKEEPAELIYFGRLRLVSNKRPNASSCIHQFQSISPREHASVAPRPE
jgi:hypothetical protein